MILKANTHNDGAKLADYMTKAKKGERVEMGPLRGFEAANIKDAFRDVEIMAGATRCEQPLFHVQVRNREGETLTKQQWEQTADRIERMLGLAGQPRAITFHTYEHNNDKHMHVAWSRIDQETLKAKPLPFFKERLKKLGRELELHFGLEPVISRREGNIRFAPTRAEDEQARRLGLDPHQVRNAIRACWDQSDCGSSFQAALEQEGLILAKGEQRDYIVVDQAGGLHALGKRILDMSASRVRERLSDISRAELPTVEIARAFVEMPEKEKGQTKEMQAPAWDRDRDDHRWQEAVINAAIEKEKVERNFVEPGDREKENRQRGAGPDSRERELGRIAGEIRLAYSLTGTGQEFANALEDRGLILACITEADAERMNRWDKQQRREEKDAAAPAPDSTLKVNSKRRQEKEKDRYSAGELIVVNEFGSTFQLSYANTGEGKKARAEHLNDIDVASLLTVSSAQNVMMEVQTERREESRELKRDTWRQTINESHAPVQPEIQEQRSNFRDAAERTTSDSRIEDLHGPVAQLWAAWCRSDDEKARAAWLSGKTASVPVKSKEDFAAALDEKGLSFAVVTKDEAYRSHRESEFAREAGRYAPRFKEGEIVLISEPRLEYRREGEIVEPNRVLRLDQTLAEKFVGHLGIHRELKSIEATLQSSNLRAELRSTEREAERMEKATDIKVFSRDGGKLKSPSAILGKAGFGIGSSVNAIADGISSLFTPTLTPEQIRDAEKARHRRVAEADHAIDYSRFTSEQAQMRQQQEDEREASRQRERGRDR